MRAALRPGNAISAHCFQRSTVCAAGEETILHPGGLLQCVGEIPADGAKQSDGRDRDESAAAISVLASVLSHS